MFGNLFVALILVKLLRAAKNIFLCSGLLTVNVFAFAIIGRGSEMAVQRSILTFVAATIYYWLLKKMDEAGDYEALFWIVAGIGALGLNFI